MDGYSDHPGPARYAVHTAKALETIVWFAYERPGIDIYHIVKCAFFADKDHLNRYGRPIAGDDYDAETYGPLGRVIYRLLKEDPIEMIALGGNGPLPFQTSRDGNWGVIADRPANLQILSVSDVASLRRALDEFGAMPFGELVEKTHADPAYIAANGGRMRYEDFLDPDDPNHDEKAADLAETARHAAL